MKKIRKYVLTIISCTIALCTLFATISKAYTPGSLVNDGRIACGSHCLGEL